MRSSQQEEAISIQVLGCCQPSVSSSKKGLQRSLECRCTLELILDFIQLKDGKDKVVSNRDDTAGFRLDTNYTHKQHKSLAEADKPELTTRTDYVNKYATVLQATSYLFMGTENTAESCVGVVKPQKVFPKKPAQHAADFEMLHSLPSTESVSKNKDVDCIRVDGASDAGPSRLEVQFMWTERHLKMQKRCTVVTSRFSGGKLHCILILV